MENPILQTINFVEDRIIRIFEDSEFIASKASSELQKEKAKDIRDKLIFLQTLSAILQRFYDNDY